MENESKYPYVNNNTQCSCPRDKKDICEYLTLEEGVKIPQKALKFVRTAKVDKRKYWVWKYEHKDIKGWAVVGTCKFFFILTGSTVGMYPYEDQPFDDFIETYHNNTKNL